MANEQNLIPAKKGEVRNPNGRPKGLPNAKTRYKRLLELVTEKANPVTGEMEEFTQLELMDMAIFSKALKGDIRAYTEIIDRLEGKPEQGIDVTTKGEALIQTAPPKIVEGFMNYIKESTKQE